MVVATAGFEPQSAGGLLLVRRKEAELLCESSQVFTRMQVPAKRSESSMPESERIPPESEPGEDLAVGRTGRGLAIVRRLQNGSARFDELVESLGEEPALLRTTLLELELEGLVQQHPGEHYSLSVEL
jgi:predicted Rossmann fold nucleotide-binding protein DprA/Smf involved in DNA uptake